MAFIRNAFAAEPLHTVEEYALNDIAVATELDMPDIKGAVICALMCKFQEAGADNGNGKFQIWCPGNDRDPCAYMFPHDSWGDDGQSTGPYQQQMNTPGSPPWGWGGSYGEAEGTRKRMDMYESTKLFMGHPSSGLKAKGYDASTPQLAGQAIQRVQGSAFPYAYDKWWDLAHQVYDRVTNGATLVSAVTSTLKPDPAWRGDPIFLPEVLKAFGVDVSTYTDARGVTWDQRGKGDFNKIDWVLWHHTGSVNETPKGIAEHPTLGLASQMLIQSNGKVVLCGAGIAWHGGKGIYPGIPEDNINQVSIGIECAYGPDKEGKYTVKWPDEQIITMVAVGAAISWFLGLPPSRNIAHKEWAGKENPLGINKQGKPDPGNLDMNWFRNEIAKRMAQGPTGIRKILTEKELEELKPVGAPGQIKVPYQNPDLEVLIQTRGRFNMLGKRTLVEALSLLLHSQGLITDEQLLQPGVVLD